jgi:hypothetical protein
MGGDGSTIFSLRCSKGQKAGVTLRGATARDKVNDQRNEGKQQKQMNHPVCDVEEHKTAKPRDQKENEQPNEKKSHGSTS